MKPSSIDEPGDRNRPLHRQQAEGEQGTQRNGATHGPPQTAAEDEGFGERFDAGGPRRSAPS